MLKALRYLKPFWLSVLAVIALTFAQVQFELALPDYMSGIVTYGIQYSGIDDPSPKALRGSTYEHMKLFMSDEEQTAFEGAYRLEKAGTGSFADTYPLSASEDIYVRDDSSDAGIPEQPFLIVTMLDSGAASDQLPVQADQLYAMLEQSPESGVAVTEQIKAQFSGYTEDNLHSAVMMAMKQEYAALGVNIEAMQNRYILTKGLFMLLITLFGSLCAVGSSYLASRTATGACRNMRADVFRRVESFSSEEFSRFSTASLITRTTNDIQQIQMVINMLLRIVLFAPFMGLTSLFKVMRYSGMAGILGWVLLIIIALMAVTFYITLPKFRIIQKLVDRLNLVIREQLSGLLVVRAFNNQETEEKRFDDVNSDITRVNIFVNRAMATIMPTMTFLMSFISVLIIWIGSKQIDLGTMQIGDMMAFLQYAIHVLMSFMIVAMIFIMIPRFFDVTEGSIMFGGTDIRNVRQKDLRDRIGYIPQKAILFSGTVESNLRYADENAAEEVITRSLEVSQAKEFVDQMPNRLQEPIAQGGTNVSGGQKQRLSIARALVKNAQVYIFDDAFSALDYATDAKLREALNKLIAKTRSTVLIVAQRISTIRHADKIVVLDNGMITGIGTHEELMKSCKVYQEIAYSQLSEEELA